MSEETLTDDQSHYEVSLTAGQAFLAFVLLLLSLAASFAFGLMIGRGQGDDRLLAQVTPAIVEEPNATARKPRERIVELGMSEEPAAAPKTTIREEAAPPPQNPAPAPVEKPKAAAVRPVATQPAAPAVPHYAQLLSTSDQKKAEALAARLIEGGFVTAYVDRTVTDKGQLHRVRVNFRSLDEARAAETKLKSYSSEVWITKQ